MGLFNRKPVWETCRDTGKDVKTNSSNIYFCPHSLISGNKIGCNYVTNGMVTSDEKDNLGLLQKYSGCSRPQTQKTQ